MLRLTPDHEVAVLEMGMWAPGEIRFLANLARPQVGIVTNVGPSHLERLGSIEAIAEAKTELPESLPADGWCILNADDERVRAMAGRTQARVLFFGLGPDADLRAEDVQTFGLRGIGFSAVYRGERRALRLPFIGRHSVYTALAGIAAGLALGMRWDEIERGLADPEARPRLSVVDGPNGATIIDDSYNAAPLSTIAALDILASLEGERVAVLGDMLELGAAEEQGHREVGRRAASAAQHLITVGPRARWIAEAARAAGMPAERVAAFATTEEATEALLPLLGPATQALVKGSRGVEMERIIAALQRRREEEK